MAAIITSVNFTTAHLTMLFKSVMSQRLASSWAKCIPRAMVWTRAREQDGNDTTRQQKEDSLGHSFSWDVAVLYQGMTMKPIEWYHKGDQADNPIGNTTTAMARLQIAKKEHA